MQWFSELEDIPLFKPLIEVFDLLGEPVSRIPGEFFGGGHYYMGNGFSIWYNTKRWYLDSGMERHEVGVEGEYFASLSYNSSILWESGIDNDFTEKGILPKEAGFEISHAIRVGSSYKDVMQIIGQTSGVRVYEGQSRKLSADRNQFLFEYNWVGWNNFEFRFYGTGKKTPLSSFQFTPPNKYRWQDLN
ncbi:hypothetical protein [Alicyclobacillus sp. SO9]|uniref:hypothetical protein n=1 Tax=Alicyclobacillus sp. SO9 TaxID=2665646 RepID=UPI0018E890E2|nr:hypothetical protein [Alicyclobacillus sp. SO9]QQE80616.1 hypothetical protein GI364_09570 [Alicyclobacillus sp. SO9]